MHLTWAGARIKCSMKVPKPEKQPPPFPWQVAPESEDDS